MTKAKSRSSGSVLDHNCEVRTREMANKGYRGAFMVPLYTEVSSFQGVGIEESHCIQRCPHFMRLE